MSNWGSACKNCYTKDGKIKKLTNDVQHLEGQKNNLEGQVEMQGIEIDQLTTNVAELAAYIQDLETALAEACLMSKEDAPSTKA